MPVSDSADLSQSASPSRSFWESAAYGTACGLISALGYMAANICLRAVAKHDPVWVSAIKAMPTVLMTAPWLAVRAARGQPVLPSGRALLALVFAALVGQFVGNIGFQWSLGVIGLAIAVPLCLAAQILGSAALGRLFLGETLTARIAAALGLLVAATAILSSGANAAHKTVTAELATQASWSLLALGLLAAAGAGMAYAILGVIIRRGVTGAVSVSTTLFTICLIGAVFLSAIAVGRIGVEGIRAISAEDHGVMVLAGLFNAIAFLSLTKSLQLIPVVYANALGATQASLAAVAGVALFHEPLTAAMLIGVVLTVAGLLSMRGK